MARLCRTSTRNRASLNKPDRKRRSPIYFIWGELQRLFIKAFSCRAASVPLYCHPAHAAAPGGEQAPIIKPQSGSTFAFNCPLHSSQSHYHHPFTVCLWLLLHTPVYVYVLAAPPWSSILSRPQQLPCWGGAAAAGFCGYKHYKFSSLISSTNHTQHPFHPFISSPSPSRQGNQSPANQHQSWTAASSRQTETAIRHRNK